MIRCFPFLSRDLHLIISLEHKQKGPITMITANAYAKINWSLSICGDRPDGYHDLDMLMQRISLCDRMTFEPSATLSLSVNGENAEACPDNLVIKAANALNSYAGTANGAYITLEKHIPARAGLGGGSADCACALIVLNKMWNINASRAELEAIGLRLGADVPFCVRERFCRAEGVGEILTPISPAPKFDLVLVTPGDGLSTPQVFRRWNQRGIPGTPVDNLALAAALNARDFDRVHMLSHNDLETPAIDLMPEIRALIDRFYQLGARFARMTGSGSTVFGIFDDPASAAVAAKGLPCAAIARTLETGKCL